MPVVICDHQHTVGRKTALLFDAIIQLLHDDRLFLLPLGVEPTEKIGKHFGGFIRLPIVFGDEQQFERTGSVCHSPRRVDSGANAEADGGRVDIGHGIFVRGKPMDQSAKSGSRRTPELFQTLHDDRAIFVNDGHHVGNRAQHRQVRIFTVNIHNRLLGRYILAPQKSFYRSNKFKGNANTRKIRKGILAIGAVRVDHGKCVGQGLSAFMMVGHHHIDPQCIGIIDLFDSGNTRIYGNNKLCPMLMKHVDGFF